MKLKQQPGDFRVLEILRDGLPAARGPHRVYRVTKSKLTTIEAAELLAIAAGVDKRFVSFAGLKDRQGITLQHMSVEGGKLIKLRERELQVEYAGDSGAPVESDWVKANAFDITIRELNREDMRAYRDAVEIVKEIGAPNYFDDQRFGSVRHGQGFVVREMIDGKIESALKRLLLYPSPFDPPRDAAFKGRLRRAWGDFELCVKLCAGGKHISIFQHLAEHPNDFRGAFRYVSQRLRLIHLYSYQSYLWNLTVSAYLRAKLPAGDLITIPTDAGPVVAYADLPAELRSAFTTKTIPLLAPDSEVNDPEVAAAVRAALAQEKLTLAALRVQGVEGFAFKAEERALRVVPHHWRAMKSEEDDLNPGFTKLRVRFELPRGAYATFMIKRLFASPPPAPLVVERPPAADNRKFVPERRKESRPAPSRPPGKKPYTTHMRESGELPKSIRGELKFVPKPPEDDGSERDEKGQLVFRSREDAEKLAAARGPRPAFDKFKKRSFGARPGRPPGPRGKVRGR